MAIAQQINQQSVDIITAKRLMENYFVNIIHMPGKGVTEGFTDDVSAPFVRVVRQKLPGILPRQLGATANGGNFNSTAAKQPQSEEFDIQWKILWAEISIWTTNQPQKQNPNRCCFSALALLSAFTNFFSLSCYNNLTYHIWQVMLLHLTSMIKGNL